MICEMCKKGNHLYCVIKDCTCKCPKSGMREAICVLISVTEFTDGIITAMEMDKGSKTYLLSIAKEMDKQGPPHGGMPSQIIKNWFLKILLQGTWQEILEKEDA